MKGQPWTEEEEQLVFALMEQGHDLCAIQKTMKQHGYEPRTPAAMQVRRSVRSIEKRQEEAQADLDAFMNKGIQKVVEKMLTPSKAQVREICAFLKEYADNAIEARLDRIIKEVRG